MNVLKYFVVIFLTFFSIAAKSTEVPKVPPETCAYFERVFGKIINLSLTVFEIEAFNTDDNNFIENLPKDNFSTEKITHSLSEIGKTTIINSLNFNTTNGQAISVSTHSNFNNLKINATPYLNEKNDNIRIESTLILENNINLSLTQYIEHHTLKQNTPLFFQFKKPIPIVKNNLLGGEYKNNSSHYFVVVLVPNIFEEQS